MAAGVRNSDKRCILWSQSAGVCPHRQRYISHCTNLGSCRSDPFAFADLGPLCNRVTAARTAACRASCLLQKQTTSDGQASVSSWHDADLLGITTPQQTRHTVVQDSSTAWASATVTLCGRITDAHARPLLQPNTSLHHNQHHKHHHKQHQTAPELSSSVGAIAVWAAGTPQQLWRCQSAPHTDVSPTALHDPVDSGSVDRKHAQKSCRLPL